MRPRAAELTPEDEGTDQGAFSDGAEATRGPAPEA